MARARNIKPGFFKNEILGVADPLYSLLFEGLWVLADRAGRLEDRPLRIKAEIFPYREGLNLDGMLNWLQENGFIQRYVSQGKKCILVLEFVKHQNPHKNEADSELPAPDQGGALSEKIGSDSEGIGQTSEKIGSTRADSLSTDSLYSDSPTPSAHEAPTACVTEPAKVCLVMKAVGVSDTNPGHPDLQMLLNAGASVAEFEGAARTAVGKGKGFAYALGTLKRTRQEAAQTAQTLHNGPLPTAHRQQPKTFEQINREEGIEKWERLTGRIHPDRPQHLQPVQHMGDVIETDIKVLEIAK